MTAESYRAGMSRASGIDIHYLEWGRRGAPAIVLLHGLGAQAHTWEPAARELGETHDVIAADLRGHGDSGWSRDGYGVHALAEDIRALIGTLGLGPVTLVGHSLGARTAIAIAGRHPELVERLVLCDAGPELSRAGAGRLRDQIMGQAALRAFRSTEELRSFYAEQYPAWTAESLDLHARHQARRNWAGKIVLKADPDTQWLTGSVSLADNPYLWELAARLTMPTLLMVAERSDVLDDTIIDGLRRRVHALEVARFDTGHFILAEAPAAFTGALRRFLGGQAVAEA